MVYKDEVCMWFKDNEPHRRIELLCGLLNMCLPFELRFIGTCVEDLGKRDFHDLREAEFKANSTLELNTLLSSGVVDDRTRSKLVVFIALLDSQNHKCSRILFKILTEAQRTPNPPRNYINEMLLIYTMVLHHPAFTFDQKQEIAELLQRVQQLETQLLEEEKDILEPYVDSCEAAPEGCDSGLSVGTEPEGDASTDVSSTTTTTMLPLGQQERNGGEGGQLEGPLEAGQDACSSGSGESGDLYSEGGAVPTTYIYNSNIFDQSLVPLSSNLLAMAPGYLCNPGNCPHYYPYSGAPLVGTSTPGSISRPPSACVQHTGIRASDGSSSEEGGGEGVGAVVTSPLSSPLSSPYASPPQSLSPSRASSPWSRGSSTTTTVTTTIASTPSTDTSTNVTNPRLTHRGVIVSITSQPPPLSSPMVQPAPTLPVSTSGPSQGRPKGPATYGKRQVRSLERHSDRSNSSSNKVKTQCAADLSASSSKPQSSPLSPAISSRSVVVSNTPTHTSCPVSVAQVSSSSVGVGSSTGNLPSKNPGHKTSLWTTDNTSTAASSSSNSSVCVTTSSASGSVPTAGNPKTAMHLPVSSVGNTATATSITSSVPTSSSLVKQESHVTVTSVTNTTTSSKSSTLAFTTTSNDTPSSAIVITTAVSTPVHNNNNNNNNNINNNNNNDNFLDYDNCKKERINKYYPHLAGVPIEELKNKSEGELQQPVLTKGAVSRLKHDSPAHRPNGLTIQSMARGRPPITSTTTSGNQHQHHHSITTTPQHHHPNAINSQHQHVNSGHPGAGNPGQGFHQHSKPPVVPPFLPPPNPSHCKVPQGPPPPVAHPPLINTDKVSTPPVSLPTTAPPTTSVNTSSSSSSISSSASSSSSSSPAASSSSSPTTTSSSSPASSLSSSTSSSNGPSLLAGNTTSGRPHTTPPPSSQHKTPPLTVNSIMYMKATPPPTPRATSLEPILQSLPPPQPGLVPATGVVPVSAPNTSSSQPQLVYGVQPITSLPGGKVPMGTPMPVHTSTGSLGVTSGSGMAGMPLIPSATPAAYPYLPSFSVMGGPSGPVTTTYMHHPSPHQHHHHHHHHPSQAASNRLGGAMVIPPPPLIPAGAPQAGNPNLMPGNMPNSTGNMNMGTYNGNTRLRGGNHGHKGGQGPSRYPNPRSSSRSTDSSPSSSQYSSPPQTPSPDHTSKETPSVKKGRGKGKEVDGGEEQWESNTANSAALGSGASEEGTPPPPLHPSPPVFLPQHTMARPPRFIPPYHSISFMGYQSGMIRYSGIFPSPAPLIPPRPSAIPNGEKSSRETTPPVPTSAMSPLEPQMPPRSAPDAQVSSSTTTVTTTVSCHVVGGTHSATSSPPHTGGPMCDPNGHPGPPTPQAPGGPGVSSCAGLHANLQYTPAGYSPVVPMGAAVIPHFPGFVPGPSSSLSNGFVPHNLPHHNFGFSPVPNGIGPEFMYHGQLPLMGGANTSQAAAGVPTCGTTPLMPSNPGTNPPLPPAGFHYTHYPPAVPPPVPQPPPAPKKPLTCYNCGQVGHRGSECKEASIEEMTKRGKVV